MKSNLPKFKPMTDEEWEKNKSCESKQRTHKWTWVWKDGHLTDTGRCVYCGVIALLSNKAQSASLQSPATTEEAK